jgi:hypothetical protein
MTSSRPRLAVRSEIVADALSTTLFLELPGSSSGASRRPGALPGAGCRGHAGPVFPSLSGLGGIRVLQQNMAVFSLGLSAGRRRGLGGSLPGLRAAGGLLWGAGVAISRWVR